LFPLDSVVEYGLVDCFVPLSVDEEVVVGCTLVFLVYVVGAEKALVSPDSVEKNLAVVVSTFVHFESDVAEIVVG